jgi:hypothetical protein
VNVVTGLLMAFLASSVTNIVHETTPIDWASPTQEAAFCYGPFPQVASGGWGASKTFGFCLKALWLSDTFPKNRGAIIRRVGKELRATTMATFYKICRGTAYDPRRGGRRNDQEGYLKLAGSESEILFLHLEDPDVEGIIKGLEINWFLWDQAEEDPERSEELFDLLLGRLGRWDQTEVPQWLIDAEQAAGRDWAFRHPTTGAPQAPTYPMLTCNPDVETHWIYRRFHPESPDHRAPIVPELDRTTLQPTGQLVSYAQLGYRMFFFVSDENKFLPAANRQFLYAHDAAFIRRNVKGIWGLPEGAIHTIDARSLIPGSYELLAYLRSTCTLFRLMDHGDTSPTCCLWMAVDKAGNVFWYREYYQPNALISTHRRNIADLSELEVYEWDRADPSIFAKVKSKVGEVDVTKRYSVADEYKDTTLGQAAPPIYWKPADNNELSTRNRINEYLRVDPDRIHPMTLSKGAPRVFFVTATDAYPQGCIHVLGQVRSQRRVKIGTELGKPLFSDERDDTITDHAYDPFRYGMASRPPLPIEAAPSAHTGTFDGARRLITTQHRRRSQGKRR